MTNTKKRTTPFPTEIGADTKVEGKIYGEEDLSILGHVLGNVTILGTVEVANGGIVEADVEATKIIISGVVVGNVLATESLIIEATGRVVGELTAPTLRVESGAQYAGRLDVGRMETKATTEPQTETNETIEHSVFEEETKSADLMPPVSLDAVRRDRDDDRPATKRVLVKKRA